jgi:hypothetical protein
MILVSVTLSAVQRYQEKIISVDMIKWVHYSPVEYIQSFPPIIGDRKWKLEAG